MAATWNLVTFGVAAVVVALAVLWSHDLRLDVDPVIEDGTSVWCHEEVSHGSRTRLCHFHNLCYLPDGGHFVFVHGARSVLSGMPVGGRFPLLHLSSVANHSAFSFTFDDLPASAAATVLHNATFVKTTALMFARFHPVNLMHVIHDDLLPLHHTLRRIAPRAPSGAPYGLQLVFSDREDEGPFHQLYTPFSSLPPLFLHRALHPMCFTDIHVGLSQETIWYQYGFDKPQGPLAPITASAAHLRPFTQYIADLMKLTTAVDNNHAVLLCREGNRLILNEAELSVAMVMKLGVRVQRVSLETHSVAEIVTALRGARLAVGMHGSLLALAVFLPPGAALVELFPYAVPPAQYTPYRTLASLPGMCLGYRAWVNTDKAATRSHPDAPPHLGGITHLPVEQQRAITTSHEVSPHLCCSDPTWLYRIYQDTVVNVAAAVSLMQNAMADVGTSIPPDIYPARVTRVDCVNGANLTVSWHAPWNVVYLVVDSVTTVAYEVWTQAGGQGDYMAWRTGQEEVQLGALLTPGTVYHVWLRCVLNSTFYSPFTEPPVLCNT